ncbi:MAG: ribonuclease Z [Bacteroidales bacterium]|nr:ribonuclease Z [Candidatus Cryptobacteroides onthequi]
MNFTLRVLGTASAKPVPDRFQSAQVLSVHGRLFLIDCGEAVQRQLVRYHIPMMKIDSLFISHIHGDHVFGIFPLLSTMGMLARTAPLNIYAPPAFGPILRFFLSYYGEGVKFEIRHIPLGMKEPEVIYHTKSVEISAFPLNHKIETFGFIFREKEPQYNVRKFCIEKYGLSLTEIGTLKRGEDVIRVDEIITAAEAAYKPYEPRSYAYCSDTAAFPELSSWVKGVSMLYHEATYTRDLEDQASLRYHSTSVQAARCALEAGVGRLILGHYSARVKKPDQIEAEARAIFPDTTAANDGDIFDLPLLKRE